MRRLLILLSVLSLAACNQVTQLTGLNKEADRATGAACRQTGRSLEVCFMRNPAADRAQVYGGWREMNEYMTKEKLPTMIPPPEPTPMPALAPVAQAHGAGGAAQPVHSPEAGGGSADPEVQAVLDTINNRPPTATKSADPTAGELQQMQKILHQDNQSNKDKKIK